MDTIRVFSDQNGDLRVIRVNPPIFIGTIINAYKVEQPGLVTSRSFEVDGTVKRVRVDTVQSDVKDSKLEWALNRSISSIQHKLKGNAE